MKIMVTGGLGHIGSHLIRNIEHSNIEEILVVDNLSTQRYPSLFCLPEHQKFKFKEEDVNSKNLDYLISESDIIIHLAATTNAELSVDKVKEVERTNIDGLKNIAQMCVKHNKKIIFPSTTSVYGKQEGEVDESCDENELRPQSPYAESKIFGENYLKELSLSKGLQYSIIRIGTIFGFSPGIRFHTAVNKFIWQANLGQPITVWRTAIDQLRPYCGLNDLNAAIQHIINNDLFNCETYNIVTTNTTVRSIINILSNLLQGVNVKYVDSPIMNQLSYEVSNAKSVKEGFVYEDDLETSIRETLTQLSAIRNET